MKISIKKRLTKITIIPFLIGFIMGFLIDVLIIPGLTIPNIYLNIITTLLLIVMVIYHYQFTQLYYWNRKKQEILEEIEKTRPELFDKLLKSENTDKN